MPGPLEVDSRSPGPSKEPILVSNGGGPEFPALPWGSPVLGEKSPLGVCSSWLQKFLPGRVFPGSGALTVPMCPSPLHKAPRSGGLRP